MARVREAGDGMTWPTISESVYRLPPARRLAFRIDVVLDSAFVFVWISLREPGYQDLYPSRLFPSPNIALGMIVVNAIAMLAFTFNPEDRARVRLAPRMLGGKWTAEAILAMTAVAGFLAGPRRARLCDAWAADLCGDPETGKQPSARRRASLAAGFIVAALRCRLDDAADLAWQPVDALLSSRHASNLATFVPVTMAAGLIVTRDGFYGLIANADNLGVIAGVPYAAIKGLRKYRQISTPKRPEKKASPAGSDER